MGRSFRGLSLSYDTPNQHTAVLASRQWETGDSNSFTSPGAFLTANCAYVSLSLLTLT